MPAAPPPDAPPGEHEQAVVSRLLMLMADLDLAAGDPFWHSRGYPETIPRQLHQALELVCAALKTAQEEARRRDQAP